MVVFINTDNMFNVTTIRLRCTTRFPIIAVLEYDKILDDLQDFIRFYPSTTINVTENTCILKHFKNTCKLS